VRPIRLASLSRGAASPALPLRLRRAKSRNRPSQWRTTWNAIAFFANQEHLKRADLEAYARDIGLDLGRFKQDLDHQT
jgi:hypothetical protein